MKVVNIKNFEKYDVYIGRGSKFGNPFTHYKHLGGPLIIVASREEAIQKYKDWVYEQPELIKIIKDELKNKILGCYCKPLPCHGDFLLQIANEE